ncbi:MAG: hypothetical protein IJS09_09615 [Treponema sp.]|nr:hypothetical protein [Treponema sp.]
MKKLCILGAIMMGFSTSFAQDAEKIGPEEIIEPALLEKIKEKGEIHQETTEFSFFPKTTLAKNAIGTWEKDEEPNYSAENLYYLKKATLVANSKDKSSVDTSLDSVAKVIRSISKMKGMQYYSNGDKKWETLYHNAYMVEGANSKQRIDDQIDGNADGKTYYCLLDDNSFGDGIYQLDYHQSENEVSLCLTNVESLKVAMFKGVKPRFMKINLVVTDIGDAYLVYMVVQAKYAKISFLESRIRRSLAARVDAIYNWFKIQF